MMEIKVTDVPSEMIEIGKQIASEKSYLYTEERLENIRHDFSAYGGKYVSGDDFIYQYIYDHWMYGVNVEEEYTYRFKDKSHAEKSEYLTWESRFPYYPFLNNTRDVHILDNKYEAYLKLKEYYKREAILVSEKGDLDLFRDFVKRHVKVIVKPVNLYRTIGLRLLKANEITDYNKVLDELLESAEEFMKIDSGSITKPAVIVEEFLSDCSTTPPFNKDFLSPIRCTTVLTDNGVEFLYPAFRTIGEIVKNENGVDPEKTEMFFAAIDKKSGKIISGGYDYFGNVFERHPLTGQKFEGTQLPEWDRLLEMLKEAALKLPSLRYVGWDVAYSKNGWCIIEGNSNGEFFTQMVYGHGFKSEFEKLIGWNLPDQIWKHPLFRKEQEC